MAKKIRNLAIVVIIGISVATGAVVYKQSLKAVSPNIDRIEISSTLPELNQSVLASDSSLIVEGTVQEIEPSKWNTSDGKAPDTLQGQDVIYTDVIVQVENVLKGQTNQTVTVRLYEGEIPDSTGVKR